MKARDKTKQIQHKHTHNTQQPAYTTAYNLHNGY